MGLKSYIRSGLLFLHIDLTQNLAYDRRTKVIMKRVIQPLSHCIDVGCHKGEMLDTILQLAPGGRHYAFEPLPDLFRKLKQKYGQKATILPYALSDHAGTSSFQYVKNAPAYSGILKRKYAVPSPDIEEIHVELKTLDEVIPADADVDFIKIDVEGGEFGVLRGALGILKRCKPVVIFECGLGASDYYGTRPEELYGFLTEEAGMHISLLKSYIEGEAALTKEAFCGLYKGEKEFYYVAHP